MAGGNLVRRILPQPRGGAAMGAALGAQWFLHLAAPEAPFAPYAFAARAIRETPGWLATWTIELLGHQAKPLLAAGVVVLLFALAGLVRSAGWTVGLVAAMAVAAVLVDPAPLDLEGSALSVVAAVAAAAAVVAAWDAAASSFRRERPGRRRLLVAGGGVAAGAACLALGLSRRSTESPLALPALTQPFVASPGFEGVAGLSAMLTAPADHYVVDINFEPPRLDGPSWRLRIDGLVEEPRRLRFDEIARPDAAQLPVLLHCISNPVGGRLIGNALWTCVPLADVLAESRPMSEADSVVAYGADGYSVAIPSGSVDEVFVAWAMGGEGLPRRHGFPVRLLWPGRYGMLSVKWLTRLEVTTERVEGYWAARGWDREGLLETGSRIDVPRRAAEVGEVEVVAGVAWARTGVGRVEVSVDDGATWREAEVEAAAGPFAWRRWKAQANFAPGRTTLTVRAQDADGAAQTEDSRAAHPYGATGLHRVIVERDAT